MVYELRTYIIPEGRMPEILDRFSAVTFRLFERHGMAVVGFWTVSKPETDSALVYLMRFPDEQSQDRAWEAFRTDPEWKETRERTEADGPIVTEVISKNLQPTDFSPLR
jgi:hypothetical protein